MSSATSPLTGIAFGTLNYEKIILELKNLQ
jgi:hypothetical protein